MMTLLSIFKPYYSYMKVTTVNLPFLSHQEEDGTHISYGGLRLGELGRWNVRAIQLVYTKSHKLKQTLPNCRFANIIPLEKKENRIID